MKWEHQWKNTASHTTSAQHMGTLNTAGIFRSESCVIQCSLTMAPCRHAIAIQLFQRDLSNSSPAGLLTCTLSASQKKSRIQNSQVTIYNSFLLSVFSGSCFCYFYCISRKSVHMPTWKTEKRPIMVGSRETYAAWEQLSPTFSPEGENREYIKHQQPLTKRLCISNQNSL